MDMQIHENNKKKVPDHLADPCKHSSANWIGAGLRPPMDFFYLSNML